MLSTQVNREWLIEWAQDILTTQNTEFYPCFSPVVPFAGTGVW
jgi:hypothetical protein